MIIFLYDSKSYIRMNKYNIASFFKASFWSCFNSNVIFNYDFHKVQMYATHIVVIMEASVECMCSNTNAFENQGKYIHEQTINDE